jgi:tartrate/fumarate subfamily iron-sulfur-dependent hydro-lyase beta chain
MKEYHLSPPFSAKDVCKLRVGDLVYLSGRMFTARDKAHQLLLKLPEKSIPTALHGLPLYHCGPLMRQRKGTWEVLSAGPTTSRRFESLTEAVVKRLDTRLLVGKGGMGKHTGDILRTTPGAYLAFTGGAGVLAAEQISSVVDVFWLQELGMADAVWLFEVTTFGPLVVAMDAHGASLYAGGSQ